MSKRHGCWIKRRSWAARGTRRLRPPLDGVGITHDHLLEPRTLLSTIVVSTTNDSGTGSLRAAVTDATNGDAIVFAKRLAGHTITLQSEIDITSNISISGAAGRPVVLSGGGTTRLLEVDGANVSLANLVITQGSAAPGGGGILEASGRLSLNNVRFTGNVAYGSTTQIAQGGAIAQQSGELTINRSTFTGNRVVGDPNSPVVYPPSTSPIGPIVPLGPITPDAVLLFPSPLDYGGEADGGAIASQAGTLSIARSTFRGNTAVGSAVTTANTGGDAYGGAIYVATASLMSSNTVFQGNQVIGGDYFDSSPSSVGFPLGAGSASGGAVASNSGSLTLQNDSFRANKAAGGDAQSMPGTFGGEGGNSSGGAIALFNSSTASLFGGIVSGNQSLGGTGSSPSNSVPQEFPSSGTAVGGGISASGTSSITVSKITFTTNKAKSGDSPTPLSANSYAYAANASGGAIEIDGTGNLMLTGATLRDNKAIGGNAQSPGQAFGGGVSVDRANSVSIFASTLQGNLAETGHGFVALPASVNPNSLEYAEAAGGGLYVSYAPEGLSVANTRIIANRAVGVENGVAVGGGLSFSVVGVDLMNDTLQSNRAVGGSIVTNSSFGEASGGAIASSGPMTVIDTNFLDNRASTASVNQAYAQKGSNDASLGGAIASQGAEIRILGGSFIGNRATGGAGTDGGAGANGQGGAIFSIGEAPAIGPLGSTITFVTVTGATFQKNVASGGTGAARSSTASSTAGAGEGGAIDDEEYSSLELSSSKVMANQAMAPGNGSGNGGGLYLAALSTNTLAQDTVVKNKASTAGDNIDNLSQ
jgi:hypothetical protein